MRHVNHGAPLGLLLGATNCGLRDLHERARETSPLWSLSARWRSSYSAFPSLLPFNSAIGGGAPPSYGWGVIGTASAADRELRITGLVANTLSDYVFGIRAYTALGSGAMTQGAIGVSTGLQGPYAVFGVPDVPYQVVRVTSWEKDFKGLRFLFANTPTFNRRPPRAWGTEPSRCAGHTA